MSLSRELVLATLAAGYTIILLVKWQNKVKKLPPGPPKLPFIDNLLNMPAGLDAKLFEKVGKEHNSEIVHFGTLGTNIVVLNSYRVAVELLDKRSGIYSSRPTSTMFNLCGWGFQFSTWKYGESWRRARKLFTKWFSIPEMHQTREAFYINRLLTQLLAHPDDFFKHIRHVPGAITLDMTYGVKVETNNDPYVNLAEKAATDGSDIFAAGAHAVDIIPALQNLPEWTPGAAFLRKAAWSRELARETLNTPFEASRKMMRSGGNYNHSFVTNALEDSESAKDPMFVRDVAGAVYLAGSDTTTAALGTLILAMLLHPEVQKKAQAELDSVLQGRLPTHEDLTPESLPYLTAVVWEIFRWQPITPIGVTHSVIEDDIFEGLLIQKDALVAPNHWAMLNDERDFPEPRKFRPERYYKDGKLECSGRNPMDISFGFGRRICPGRHIAQSILMLTAASILSTFDISKRKDSKGNDIEVSEEYRGFLIAQPLQFPCDIKPRSPHAVKLIQSLTEL